MRSAIDGAERNLRSSHQPCAEAACTALASFGEEGWRVLEKYVLDPRRWLAAKAIEALAAAQTGIRPIPELR
jgi:hypothetical protein